MTGVTAPADPVAAVAAAAAARQADDILLLVLGLDGVLVDYQEDPGAVVLPQGVLQQLQALAAAPSIAIAFISGRRVRDLRARCPLGDAAFYIGLHGLEVEGPDFVATDHGAFERYSHRIRAIADAVEPLLGSVDGVRVENKETAIAVHTREAGSADAVWARLHLLNAAADLVNRAELRPVRGYHVLELLPNVRASRANAVRSVRHCIERRSGKSVYSVVICEGTPDDDAGAAIDGRGTTVSVGEGPAVAGTTRWTPPQVHRLIEQLVPPRR